jgi:Type III restriction enzyme, res subunit
LSLLLMPVGYWPVSRTARTLRPVAVVVLLMRSTMTWWLAAAVRQFKGDVGERSVFDLVPLAGAGALGYWTTKRMTPATVVMPTGTGKTETMLALLVAARPDRLLVLVPSDSLREQVAAKSGTLGVLQ